MPVSKLCGAILAAVAATAAVSFDAGAAETKRTASAPNVWAAWGGELGFVWNEDLLRDVGVTLDARVGTGSPDAIHGYIGVAIRDLGGLEFAVEKNNFDHFVGGNLTLRGGFTLQLPDGEISLVDASLRPRKGDAQTLDLVGSDGKAWFYLDKLMYEISDGGNRLSVRTMDLRIAPALADRLGKPFIANWEVAQLRMDLNVFRQGAALTAPTGGPNWPGNPAPGGLKYEADVFMSTFTGQYSRCRRAAGAPGNCDGPAGSDEGEVVFTPSSTLRNNVNAGTMQQTIGGDPLGTSTSLWTADVAWYEKFTGTFDPYRMDQHPFLIWNLYRIDAQGRIDQIGRSGVKHAFLTTNGGCLDGAISSHILSRGCSDTYGTGNNDSSGDLGPRGEIIPNLGLWGRCGSIFDTNCDGSANTTGNTQYSQRLIVKESQLDPVENAGATYYFESWYIVRDDVNIYNTMANRPVTTSFAGSGPWSMTNGTPMRLGPAINRWVDPATTNPNERNVELASDEGHTRVAVKAIDLGKGEWRYEYAVMNFDFARAVTSGTTTYDDDAAAPANRFRVTHNFGYDRFSIPLPKGVTPTVMTFSDGDANSGNDWTASIVGTTVTWQALTNPSPPVGVPAVLSPLNWGTMYRFTLIATGAPIATDVDLHIAQSGSPQSHTASVLGPSGAPSDAIFKDDFEP